MPELPSGVKMAVEEANKIEFNGKQFSQNYSD
jgi:hypothetical protein